jgi:ribonuclease Y
MALTALIAAAFCVLGIAAGYFARRYWATKKFGESETRIVRQIAEAETKAKEIIIEAKEKAALLLVETKNEERGRRKDFEALEVKILNREEALDKRGAAISAEESNVRAREDKVRAFEDEVRKKQEEARVQIEKVAGLSREEARETVVREIKEERSKDLAQMIQKLDRENHDEMEKRGSEIISTALQRYARSHVSEITTSVFHLADEDLKGKIIGREGRNIRALEQATGVEFIIDEAPNAILISSFDPYRREVARMALDKLVRDGRIQPAKIEEKVEEARAELEKRTDEIGKTTAEELGIFDMPKEILRLVGALHFRSSYGQNVLNHSVEMAYISEMMARELGLNFEVAKRAALVHDIGKALDHEIEGTHVDLGMKVLRKYNVDERVIQAMQSHHDDYPYASSEAYVVTAADVLSAARPGARRGTLENYIKRLADLERIAGEFPGVKNAYAIAAGRELRVFVTPEKVDDFRALELAREIANKIQSELKYPGEIKVNVIREIRAVEYAR